MVPVWRVVPGAKVDEPQVTTPESLSLQLYVALTGWFNAYEFATPPLVDGAGDRVMAETVGVTVSMLTGIVKNEVDQLLVAS